MFERVAMIPCRPGGPEYVVYRAQLDETTWAFRFTVQGKGPFPGDMLRHDRCYPADTNSALAMINDMADRPRPIRQVTLAAQAGRKLWLPTFERWRSFGWMVTTELSELPLVDKLDGTDEMPEAFR
jgi:hypothetical protein